MQALMIIQYYMEPENIYRPKLSRMKMNYILRSTKIGWNFNLSKVVESCLLAKYVKITCDTV